MNVPSVGGMLMASGGMKQVHDTLTSLGDRLTAMDERVACLHVQQENKKPSVNFSSVEHNFDKYFAARSEVELEKFDKLVRIRFVRIVRPLVRSLVQICVDQIMLGLLLKIRRLCTPNRAAVNSMNSLLTSRGSKYSDHIATTSCYLLGLKRP